MGENIKKKVKKRKYKRNKKIFAFVVVFITLLSAAFYHFYFNDRPVLSGERLTVRFIDVGQGDASLVITPDGSAMLIDTGPSQSKNKLKRELDEASFKDLDFVVFTHPDEDHIGNAETVLRGYTVITVLMPDFSKNTNVYKKMMAAIEEEGIKLEYPEPNTKYELGEVEFVILAPISKYKSSNNNSIVLRLKSGQNTFLFMGDAESEAEKDMLNAYNKNVIGCDVIKVGHHGSSSSSTKEFINAVMPLYAIISCGKNNTYGHPSSAVVSRLQAAGARILRTDKDGTIIIQSDGKNIYVVE